jgi:hypothetical protein
VGYFKKSVPNDLEGTRMKRKFCACNLGLGHWYNEKYFILLRLLNRG